MLPSPMERRRPQRHLLLQVAGPPNRWRASGRIRGDQEDDIAQVSLQRPASLRLGTSRLRLLHTLDARTCANGDEALTNGGKRDGQE
jgi:hypothetical protein